MNNVIVEDILNEMSDEQRRALYYIIGYALDTGIDLSCTDSSNPDNIRFKDIYEKFTDEQKAATTYLLRESRMRIEDETYYVEEEIIDKFVEAGEMYLISPEEQRVLFPVEESKED